MLEPARVDVAVRRQRKLMFSVIRLGSSWLVAAHSSSGEYGMFAKQTDGDKISPFHCEGREQKKKS